MPLIHSKRRINPLDLNKNVELGLAFPLNEVNMFKGTESVREQLKANLLNLLLTEEGERINRPDYGIGLKKLLFEQNINKDQLGQIITEKVTKYIRDLKITNILFSNPTDDHSIHLLVEFRYELDNSLDGIQLNFN